MLIYDAYALDEYIKIDKSTSIENIKKLSAIVEIFSAKYLRSPTPNHVYRLFYIGEKLGFPEMLKTLNCIQ